MEGLSFFRTIFTILLLFLVFLLSPFSFNGKRDNSIEGEEFSKAKVISVLEYEEEDVQREESLWKKENIKGRNLLLTTL